MKKYLLSIMLSVLICIVGAAAADSGLFPTSYTGEDGATRWGYLDEAGVQQVGYFYASAEPFNNYGFAIVKNTLGETGVLDATGKPIIECREAPQSIDFSDGAIAFRYPSESIYYDFSGNQTGIYQGAAGFFNNGLLRVQRGGKWGYVNQSNQFVIPAVYTEAGDFFQGNAFVKDEEGAYRILDTDGTGSGVPAEPATLQIYPNSLVILRVDNGFRLYSLETDSYITETYDQMTVQDDGYVMVQKDKKWGVLTAKGSVSIPLQYYYMSYMGEGVYAARGADDTAAEALDSSGALIYRTDTYAGGFETFRFGQSWHGTMDGGILFFNKNGILSRKIENAANPVILSADVARVTVNGETQYIRLSDGNILYAPVRAYEIEGGIKVTTKTYEKYLGMKKDGTEFGWKLEYPQFSGMKDVVVQKKINSQIEKFFLDGPGASAQKQSLAGSYGFAFYGRVLVVYADAKLGLDTGATIWNDNIALDFGAGTRFSAMEDLLLPGYEQAVLDALPDGAAFDKYIYPRMTADSLIFYRMHPQTANTAAYADEVKVYYNQIWNYINQDGACYQALSAAGAAQAAAPAAPSPAQSAINTEFMDVPAAYWAKSYIEEVSALGLMQGADGHFRPDEAIAASEAVVTIARALKLSDGVAPGVSGVWYAGPYGGAYEAGLLAGLDALDPNALLTRVDAMQLFANALRRTGSGAAALTQEEIREILQPYTDALDLAPEKREAAAWCVKNGIISGTDGALAPNMTLTRAEFAKLLTALLN